MKKILLLLFAYLLVFNAANAQLNTAGKDTWKPLYNSMVTWEDGAFNMNQTGHPDYGWGVYNSITHGLTGDSIYLITLQDGAMKQILIEEKNSAANTYTFRFADISGENEVVAEALCKDYSDRLFLYYSLSNMNFVDRDPANADWDMVLTKYTDTVINYPVTGFLLNENSSVSVFHAPNADAALNSTLADTSVFNSDIAVIGNSWNKVVGFSIVPLDTMVYFVKTAANEIYKMRTTFFESGSSMGTGKGRVGVAIQKLAPVEGAVVNDTLVMENGYANDVYFSMEKGVTKTSPRNSWDIAFKTNIYSASIITNSTMGISLYTYPSANGEGLVAWQSLPVQNAKIDPASVYPNPANDIVRFNIHAWKENSEVQLSVYNISGKLVLKQTQMLSGTGFFADFGNLPVGIYHAQIINNGSYSSVKILVSR